MKMNLDALKALELKLAEYSKENGSIGDHASANSNSCSICSGSCKGDCQGDCKGSCKSGCDGSCKGKTR